ncbi:hypothetical protein A8G00_15495 [Sphingobium sp. SA916]|nr:hypothetical protein A8G00_15495 [Sphingobium sp. SA916]
MRAGRIGAEKTGFRSDESDRRSSFLVFRDFLTSDGYDRLEIALEQIPIRSHRLDCSKFLFYRVFRVSR